MKKISKILLLAIFISTPMRSENSLSQMLSNIKNKVVEVQVDKSSIRQSLEILNESKGKLRLTSIVVDEKGKTSKSTYEFYITDIDKNTIIRSTQGKKMFVSMSLYNKQKFVKLLIDDKPESYTNNVEIIVSETEAAQIIIDNMKSAISQIKTVDKTWTSANEALLWLKNNVKEVAIKSGSISQSLSFNEKRNYLIDLTTRSIDSKGIMIEDVYNINLLDVNKTKIQLKIVGVSLTVYLETKGTENLIRQTKSGQLQNYINKLEIYADDIDQARNIIAALNTSIEKSKLINPDFKTVQEATEFIEHNIGEITPANKKINQKIDFKAGNAHGVTFANDEMDSKGNVLKNTYEFYLSDINPTSLQFTISGKKIALELKTQNRTNLIKYTKQAELQNFVSEIEILNDDIETTRELIYAYDFSIRESMTAPIKWGSISAANEFLNSTFKGDRIGTDQYKLAFEADDTDPYQCKYKKSITDSKGIETAEQCLFYPFTIDPEQIKIESGGKYLIISAFTKSKSYYIKKTKKELSSFDSDLKMISFDAKEAKDIASAIKYLSTNALPKQKDWNSKVAAMSYVAQTIGNFSSVGKEIKQKLELVDNDPSKVSYKVSTLDNNGKSIEEIYEFSLTDMNRLMVEFKTQGENVIISMTCKNRNKFVKVYKNGEQQVYGSVVEITEKDINTAKNIADALRYTIIKCE